MIMSSGTHLKLCLIIAISNTFTPLRGEEEVQGGRGGGGEEELCGVMRDRISITVETGILIALKFPGTTHSSFS
jgi:hypothetical protein